jgi:hypothetical protein
MNPLKPITRLPKIPIMILLIFLLFSCNKDQENQELIIRLRENWDAIELPVTESLYKYPAPIEKVFTRIILHHSAFPDQPGPLFIQEYQIYKMGFDDIAYHYIIGDDGEIYEGRLIEYMGAHAGQTKEANELANRIRAGLIEEDIKEAMRLDPDYGSIGICLDGNFDNDEPGEAQLESLSRLVKYLQEKYNIEPSNIFLHKEVNEKIVKSGGLTPKGEETVCPGEMGSMSIKQNFAKNY